METSNKDLQEEVHGVGDIDKDLDGFYNDRGDNIMDEDNERE